MESRYRKKILNLLSDMEFVDWDDTPYVACDRPCFALREPQTTEELRDALEHWRDHRYQAGCSHAR